MEDLEKKVKSAKNTAKKSAAKKTAKKTAPKVAKKSAVAAKTANSVKTETAKSKVLPRDNSNVNPEFTDAFIREVTEDVKNDSFKELWNRYGLFVVAFVVIAVSAAVSFEKIKSWKVEQTQMQTEAYMMAAEKRSDPENTIAALKNIQEKGNGIFSDFARLQIANVKLEQNKTDEALVELEAIMKDEQVNSEVRQVALIKFATYKVDVLSKDDFAALLKPIIEANNSWTPIANDLLAMSAIRAGDIETAKEIYANILKVKDLPESFRTKVQDMLSSISDM